MLPAMSPPLIVTAEAELLDELLRLAAAAGVTTGLPNAKNTTATRVDSDFSDITVPPPPNPFTSAFHADRQPINRWLRPDTCTREPNRWIWLR